MTDRSIRCAHYGRWHDWDNDPDLRPMLSAWVSPTVYIPLVPPCSEPPSVLSPKVAEAVAKTWAAR